MLLLVRRRVALLGFLLLTAFTSQSQDWLWAREASRLETKVAMDSSGTTYKLVDLEGLGLHFGTLSFYDSTGSIDRPNVALLKTSATGVHQWSRQATGWGGAICVDPTGGGAYTVTYFRDSCRIGPLTLRCAPGEFDFVVSKWSPTGALLWAVNNGGTGWRFPQAITADSTGNVYVAGRYNTSPSLIGGVTLPVTGQHRLGFVLKLGPGGSPQWVRSTQRLGPAPAPPALVTHTFTDLKVGAGGMLYAGLLAYYGLAWGTLQVPAQAGYHHGLSVQLATSTGQLQQSAALALPTYTAPRRNADGISVDGRGSFYLFHRFHGRSQVGGVSLVNPLTLMQDSAGSLVARFSLPGGTLQWVRHLTQTGLAREASFGIDYYGRTIGSMLASGAGLLISGTYYTDAPYPVTAPTPTPGTGYGSLLIDGIPEAEYQVNTHVGSNVGPGYVASLEPVSGQLQWLKQITVDTSGGSWGETQPACRAANQGGDVFVEAPLDFSTACFDSIRVSTIWVGYSSYALLGPANHLRGQIFLDRNGNGVRDLGEAPHPQTQVVRVDPTGEAAAADSTGAYRLLVRLGASTVVPPPTPLHYTLVRTGSPTVSFATFGNTAAGPSFAYQPIPNQQDLRVDLTPSRDFIRPAGQVIYQILVTNSGTTTLPADSLTLTLDSRVAFVNSSTPTAPAVRGRTLRWTRPALAPTASYNVTVLVQANTLIGLGDTLTTRAMAYPLSGDVVPADNAVTDRLPVRTSWDPNSLEVDRPRLTPAQAAAGAWLDYVARFENVGTDTAFAVLVRSALPTEQLDLTTLQVVAASQPPVDWTLWQGNTLQVRFPGIELPPRSIDSLKCHGFVRFRVRLKAGVLVLGDTVAPQARIYFDYNAPVLTNYAVTRVALPLGTPGSVRTLGGHVWPNPASETVQWRVNGAANAPATARLRDLTGRAVRHTTGVTTGQLDVRGLSAGLYLLEVEQSGRRFTQRVVVGR